MPVKRQLLLTVEVSSGELSNYALEHVALSIVGRVQNHLQGEVGDQTVYDPLSSDNYEPKTARVTIDTQVLNPDK